MKPETFQTINGELTEHGLIDYLTYCSYRANRGYSPEITPEQWETIYGPCTKGMEERLRAESLIQAEAIQ